MIFKQFHKLNNMKTSAAVVLAVLLVGACFADVYMTRQAAIKEMQNSGIEEMLTAIDTSLYREAEQKEIQKILDSTEAAIRESDDQAEIDALVDKAIADTAGFKTDEIYATEEEGVEKLKASVDLSNYREAEQKEIKKILDSTETAISESEDPAEIETLISEASKQFAEFKTDAEYTAEEEAARQAAAAAAAAKQKSSKKESSGSKGCVGTGSDVFN